MTAPQSAHSSSFPHYSDQQVTVHHGDCLDVLREMPDASVDAVVTDPPYGLEFMGREWDSFKPSAARIRERVDGRTNPKSGKSVTTTPEAYVAGHPFQQWCEQWTAECLRVLRPGGHLLAFGGTRTWHRLACAVEDAGFEVRDSIAWLHGQGFAKGRDFPRLDYAANGDHEDAAKWAGWNVALKPAHEPIVVARKPLAAPGGPTTVAANVLAHGTGALNIDGCRVQMSDADRAVVDNRSGVGFGTGDTVGGRQGRTEGRFTSATAGRWPTNVALDGDAADELDAQSGNRPGFSGGGTRGAGFRREYVGGERQDTDLPAQIYSDSGGASRFFPTFKYQAKAPTRERVKVDGVAHPTVKPLALMRWLVRLVTPPGGVVLEPFAGSGTTVEAATIEGFRCIAVEREADYLPLILQRIQRCAEDDPSTDRKRG